MFETSDWESCTIDGIPTLKCIFVAANNVLSAALVIAGIAAVILIIISGYKFVTSEGDPERVDSAKKTLTYAIAGLIFIILSFSIIAFFGYVTGADRVVPGS